MKLVEICGPSGVGKSTVYAEMLKRQEARSAQRDREDKQEARSAQRDREGKEAGRTTFVPNPKPALDVALHAIRRASLEDIDIAAFVALLERIWATATGPMLRARQSHMARSLYKTLWARRNPDPRPLVVDGGLTQRGQAIDRLKAAPPMEIYYDFMPAPDLIVMLTAPLETLVARNRTRGRARPDHDRSAWAADSMAMDALAQKIFARRGLHVLLLDALRPAEENAEIVLANLPDLAAAAPPTLSLPHKGGGDLAACQSS